jgi:hypothetical protein
MYKRFVHEWLLVKFAYAKNYFSTKIEDAGSINYTKMILFHRNLAFYVTI